MPKASQTPITRGKQCKRGHDAWIPGGTSGFFSCQPCAHMRQQLNYWGRKIEDPTFHPLPQNHGRNQFSNETEDEELARLIAQQERDMKFGDTAWGQHRIKDTLYIDSPGLEDVPSLSQWDLVPMRLSPLDPHYPDDLEDEDDIAFD